MQKPTKRIRAESTAGHVRTSASLPRELHRRLMLASVETRMVATEIVRRAVAEWLERHEKKSRRTRP